MRCARCDRPAVPQALGVSSQGQVVFGWCVACLRETGCREISVTPRDVRRRTSRLDLSERRESRRPSPTREARRIDSMENRLRLLRLVARVLALWGLMIGLVGVSLFFRRPLQPLPPASTLGNGTPALLIGGGGTTALVGLSLWAWTTSQRLQNFRPQTSRSQRSL